MLCLNIIAWITNCLWYACAVLLITMVAAHLQRWMKSGPEALRSMLHLPLDIIQDIPVAMIARWLEQGGRLHL